MNIRVAAIAGFVYVIAIVIALFAGGLLPVLIVGALLVGLVNALAGGGRPAAQEGGRNRNRNRNRNRGGGTD